MSTVSRWTQLPCVPPRGSHLRLFFLIFSFRFSPKISSKYEQFYFFVVFSREISRREPQRNNGNHKRSTSWEIVSLHARSRHERLCLAARGSTRRPPKKAPSLCPEGRKRRVGNQFSARKSWSSCPHFFPHPKLHLLSKHLPFFDA